MSIARFARALLTAACLLLAVPALASAAYTVNAVEDEPDALSGGACETAAGKCSLRAAIELTNFAMVEDNILFDPTVFEGQSADAIVLNSSLPIILAPIVINAGTCPTAALVNGPCAAVSGSGGQTAFRVAAAEAGIFGLAIYGADKGIDVSGDEFIARGNWLGVELDGTSASSDMEFGIALEPGADGAQIGGGEVVHRNVFANTGLGLRLRGVNNTVVEGNYFGVAPDGTTEAPNTRNLVVADSAVGVSSGNNRIGTENEDGAGTAACDFGCNVFVSDESSEQSIDLQGKTAFEEKPATGPTAILGNYIGLDATGAAAEEAAEVGIAVGSAGSVRIGGLLLGEANQIHGGQYGVFAGLGGEPAKGLQVLGNNIGRARDNSAPLFEPDQGLGVFSAGILAEADAAVVEENNISVEGIAIENHSAGAAIVANRIYGGFRGIDIWGSTEESGIGNLVEGNTIAGAESVGVFIRNDYNQILGNTITGAGTGISLEGFNGVLDSTENLIGGDGDGEGNVVSNSLSYAVEIIDIEGSQNEIGRNSGSGNVGKFIRLKPANGGEPLGPNGGIKPPAVATASKTEASGTAVAGAAVRVFSKVSTSPGELGAYLGKVTADSGGEWKLTYLSPVAGGTFVAATQTNEDGGTSEVSATAGVPPDPPSGCPAVPSECPPSSSPPPGPPAPDTTKPKVTIKKAPKAKSNNTTAKFKFVSSETGSKFKCKLDKKAWAGCKSPKTYKKLQPGKHVFKVKATDVAGNTSAVLTRKFTVTE